MRASPTVRNALGLAAMAWLLLFSGSAAAQAPRENKALGQPTTASSVEPPERNGSCQRARNGCGAGNATDGDTGTRWGSDWAEGQWLQVDLGRPRAIDTVEVSWQLAFARRYGVATSLDGSTFFPVRLIQTTSTVGTTQLLQTTGIAPVLARYVRVTSFERFLPQRGVSMWELRLFGGADPVPAPGASAPQPTAPAGSSTGPPPVAASGSTPFETTSAPSGGLPPAASPAPGRRRLLAPFPTVRLKGTATRTGARIELLQIRYARGASVRVHCRGTSCSRRILRRVGSGRVASMRRFLKAGTVIEVFVTKPGTLGKYTRFVIRKGLVAPRRTDSCATHGASRPSACTTQR